MRKRLPPANGATWDEIIELQAISTAVTIGWAADGQVRPALLEAARMIRDIKMVLDALPPA
jgi:hypothetical protein